MVMKNKNLILFSPETEQLDPVHVHNVAVEVGAIWWEFSSERGL